MSIPISSYIDDGITADPVYGRCLWAVVLIVRLLNLLGAYFGLPKCHFRPAQKGDWLGFEILSKEETFRVSDKKMEKVRSALSLVLGSETITPQQIAAVAGKLISLSPAVLPASLYSRTLFQALQGKMSWDKVFPDIKISERDHGGMAGQPVLLERPPLVSSAHLPAHFVRRFGLWLWRPSRTSKWRESSGLRKPKRGRHSLVEYCARGDRIPANLRSDLLALRRGDQGLDSPSDGRQ
jgi:hypothetical protein